MSDPHNVLALDRSLVDRTLHELRKPLTAIQAFADLLEEEISGPLNADQKDYVRTIQGGVERMAGELERIRGLAELALGEPLLVRPVDASLGEVVAGLREPWMEAFAAREIELCLDVDRPAARLVVDPVRLRTALGYLLENSLRVTPAGGVVCVRTQTDGERIVFEVTDTGPGLRPLEMDRVFEPFHREGARGQDGPAPTLGVGLTLARGVARALGGELDAEDNTEAGGACFRFALDRSAALQSPGREGTEETGATAPLGRERS